MDWGLKTHEVKLIRDVIEGYANESPLSILKHLQRILTNDITPAHYVMFGWLMGELHRPKNRVLNFNLTNN